MLRRAAGILALLLLFVPLSSGAGEGRGEWNRGINTGTGSGGGSCESCVIDVCEGTASCTQVGSTAEFEAAFNVEPATSGDVRVIVVKPGSELIPPIKLYAPNASNIATDLYMNGAYSYVAGVNATNDLSILTYYPAGDDDGGSATDTHDSSVRFIGPYHIDDYGSGTGTNGFAFNKDHAISANYAHHFSADKIYIGMGPNSFNDANDKPVTDEGMVAAGVATNLSISWTNSWIQSQGNAAGTIVFDWQGGGANGHVFHMSDVSILANGQTADCAKIFNWILQMSNVEFRLCRNVEVRDGGWTAKNLRLSQMGGTSTPWVTWDTGGASVLGAGLDLQFTIGAATNSTDGSIFKFGASGGVAGPIRLAGGPDKNVSATCSSGGTGKALAPLGTVRDGALIDVGATDYKWGASIEIIWSGWALASSGFCDVARLFSANAAASLVHTGPAPTRGYALWNGKRIEIMDGVVMEERLVEEFDGETWAPSPRSTIASLPACSDANYGISRWVTDASTSTSCVAGSGTFGHLCQCNPSGVAGGGSWITAFRTFFPFAGDTANYAAFNLGFATTNNYTQRGYVVVDPTTANDYISFTSDDTLASGKSWFVRGVLRRETSQTQYLGFAPRRTNLWTATTDVNYITQDGTEIYIAAETDGATTTLSTCQSAVSPRACGTKGPTLATTADDPMIWSLACSSARCVGRGGENGTDWVVSITTDLPDYTGAPYIFFGGSAASDSIFYRFEFGEGIY